MRSFIFALLALFSIWLSHLVGFNQGHTEGYFNALKDVKDGVVVVKVNP